MISFSFVPENLHCEDTLRVLLIRAGMNRDRIQANFCMRIKKAQINKHA